MGGRYNVLPSGNGERGDHTYLIPGSYVHTYYRCNNISHTWYEGRMYARILHRSSYCTWYHTIQGAVYVYVRVDHTWFVVRLRLGG